MRLYILGVLIFLSIQILFAYGNGESYTTEEKEALEKFRKSVGDAVFHEIERRGFTIINFLRAHNLNIDETNKSLRSAGEWRKKEHIDSIRDEKVLPELFPYRIDGFDKKGLPVVYVSPPKWDIRKYVVQGKRDALVRHWAQFQERAHQKILESRNSTGNDIIQYTLIVDVQGYNFREHACLGCFPVYYDWLKIYEKYYPQDYGNIFWLNVPKAIHPLINLLKSLMSPHTRDIWKIYSSDKQEWTRELSKVIDPSQLWTKYGGMKP